MIEKGYDIAPVHRLNPNIQEIACEIEGYMHWATENHRTACASNRCSTWRQVVPNSYAIICSAVEPMEWYADNYFKALARWRKMYEEYAAWRHSIGGVDLHFTRYGNATCT